MKGLNILAFSKLSFLILLSRLDWSTPSTSESLGGNDSPWGAVSMESLCRAGWPSPQCDRFDRPEGSESTYSILSSENTLPVDAPSPETATHSLESSDTKTVCQTTGSPQVIIESPTDNSVRIGSFRMDFVASISSPITASGRPGLRIELLVDGSVRSFEIITSWSDCLSGRIRQSQGYGHFIVPALLGWNTVSVRIRDEKGLELASHSIKVFGKIAPRYSLRPKSASTFTTPSTTTMSLPP